MFEGVVVLLTLAWLVATAPGGKVDVHNTRWTEVSTRTDPQATALRLADVVRWGADTGSSFAPVATGDGGKLSVRLDQQGVAREFQFVLDNQRPGVKQRLELMNCFVTNDTLRSAGVDPAGSLAQDLRELRMLYEHCRGAPTVAVTGGWSSTVEMQVSYELLIPKDGLPSDSQSIIGQFHGREDPRVFLAPNGSNGTGVNRQRTFAKGSVIHFSTDTAARLCKNSSRHYGNCFGGQLLGPGGHPSGWLYQNGGFPPLVFGYDPVSKWFYVEGRSDDREFKMTHTKADCHFHWPVDYPSKRHCADAPHETVEGLWRQPRDQFAFDQWLRFEWLVRWSSYSNDGTGSHRNGSVSLTIAGNQVVDWRGPIGRNDGGRLPYFKIGVYNPSGVAGRTQVFFRNYTQSWKSDDTTIYDTAAHGRGNAEPLATRKNVVCTPTKPSVTFNSWLSSHMFVGPGTYGDG